MAEQVPAPELERLPRRVLAVAGRGVVLGAGLHVGIKILSAINSRRSLHQLKFLIHVIDADSVRFGLFVGIGAASYKLIKELLYQWSGEKCGWHAVVGGFVAGLLSVIDESNRRRTLSHFITARALGALVLTLNSRGILPTFPHFVSLMFGVCCSFIVVGVTRHPELLPKGYYHSILKWSVCYTDEVLEACYRKPLKEEEFVPCSQVLHDGSCPSFAVKDFCQCTLLYVKIHLAIYSIPLLLLKTKTFLSHPADSLIALAKNTIVSSLFLGVTGTVMKYMLCLLRNAWGSPPPVPYWIPATAGFAGAVGFLLERKSRRLELLYYVLPQVFYGIWRLLCIKKPLGLHRIPCGSVLLYIFSLMVLMHAYERNKSSISPLINTSLKYLLGE